MIARPFNTYGPRQSARAVIPTIITQALTRDRIELGSLDADSRLPVRRGHRSRACRSAARWTGSKARPSTSGRVRSMSIGDVVDQVLELLGKTSPSSRPDERQRPEGSEVERLLADASKARARLPWAPQVAFADGARADGLVGRAIDRRVPPLDVRSLSVSRRGRAGRTRCGHRGPSRSRAPRRPGRDGPRSARSPDRIRDRDCGS